MWVPDFRKSALYQRSLDLSHEIYRTVDEDYEKIGRNRSNAITEASSANYEKNNAFAYSAKYKDEIQKFE